MGESNKKGGAVLKIPLMLSFSALWVKNMDERINSKTKETIYKIVVSFEKEIRYGMDY